MDVGHICYYFQEELLMAYSNLFKICPYLL